MPNNSQVEIGDIYKIPLNERDNITVKDGLDHRNKYCFIVGFCEYGFYVVYFILNHELNQKFINTNERLSCQYPISRKDYPNIIYEDYDPSYLDLGTVRLMEKERMLRDGTYMGKLIESDLSNILYWLKETDQYSPNQKRKFGWI